MKDETILIAHGGGGSLTGALVRDLFVEAFDNPALSRLEDGAFLEDKRLVFTTDAFVVKPLFFPGGDIGRLAVCGTVNDLAVMGAEPLYISCAFIIEEGLSRAELERAVNSMAAAAREAEVTIVAGDTKVVERGSADRLFITTSGIGAMSQEPRPAAERVAPGDAILVSGPVGDHGMAVLSAREGLYSGAELRSDCAPLAGLIRSAARACSPKFMRDPTRGGLATALNELAAAAGLGVELDETAVPVRAQAQGAERAPDGQGRRRDRDGGRRPQRVGNPQDGGWGTEDPGSPHGGTAAPHLLKAPPRPAVSTPGCATASRICRNSVRSRERRCGVSVFESPFRCRDTSSQLAFGI